MNDKLTVPASERMKLDNQICFAFYVCSKEIIKKYRPLLTPLGLTYTGYITMLALWEKDKIPVKALGEKLYLDSGTLTPLLKKLESQGFVKRSRSEIDERQVIVSLTEAGHELQQKAAAIPERLVHSFEMDEVQAKQMIESLHFMMKQAPC
ncbi:MarR family winged helix-turn-helix transcriptional regulator [Gorillibacterium timonense]|uniref:MarR family winged helix-turn-helix transcriptional regulator n=1 Tax=Gorillibacterium timonense TaxID=1689269 RepID=UPI00071C9A11|nr:MarR family transcriptional regulator [Gorillibacterium timonense]